MIQDEIPPIGSSYIVEKHLVCSVAAESGAVHDLVGLPYTEIAAVIAPYLDGYVLVIRYPDGDLLGVLNPDIEHLRKCSGNVEWLRCIQSIGHFLATLPPDLLSRYKAEGFDSIIAEYSLWVGGKRA